MIARAILGLMPDLLIAWLVDDAGNCGAFQGCPGLPSKNGCLC
jgi:hypothetical protein